MSNKNQALLRYPLSDNPQGNWSEDQITEIISIYNSVHLLAGNFFNQAADIPAVPFSAAGPGAVGNGTLLYRYNVVGGRVQLDFQLAFGATTALGGGVGAVGFATPVGFPPIAQISSGTAVIFCAAAAPALSTGIIWTNGGLMTINIPSLAAQLTPVVPAAFAAGDSISFNINYPYIGA